MVDPHNTIEKTSWKNVRYQLLTALCGTIIQAKNDNSTIAVLVIHEFLSNVASVAKLADNHKELERFLTVASDHRGRDDADFLCPFGKPAYLAGIVYTMMWRDSFVPALIQQAGTLPFSL
jgi:hypothetical protein